MTDRIIAERYRILQQLAVGGMGETFVAEQIHLKRRVVIKTIRREWLSREGAVPRFKREAELAASISHSNIVSVFDYATEDNEMPYLVMEHVDGETLASWAQRECSLEALVSIIRPMLSGLAVLHGAGILHRDIKPTNIMLQKHEDGADRLPPGIPKLIDFGLARLFENEDMARLTRTGQIMGTPGYLAPEQVTGEEVDARTDLYAVCVVLYRCLSRRFPFEGNDPAALIKAVLSKRPTPLDTLCPDLPDAFVEVVHRGLEKSPANRFQSAAELSDALEPWDGAIPAQVRSSSPRLSVPISKTVETAVPDMAGDRSLNEDTPIPEQPSTRPRKRSSPNNRPLSPLTWLAIAAAGTGIAGIAGVLVYQQLALQERDTADVASPSSDSAPERTPTKDEQSRTSTQGTGDAAVGSDAMVPNPSPGSDSPKAIRTELPGPPPRVRMAASRILNDSPEATGIPERRLLITSIVSPDHTVRVSDVRRWFSSVSERMSVCFHGTSSNLSHMATVEVDSSGRAKTLDVISPRRHCLRGALPGRRFPTGAGSFQFRLRWYENTNP